MSSSLHFLKFLSISLAFAVITKCSATSSNSKNGANPILCTMCRIVVTEANWSIGQIDPKKVIETGSFRVDPDGQQPYKIKKKYARSETYLEELLEDICDKLRNYAELKTQKPLESKHIVRWQGFNKETLQVKDLKLDYDAGKNLIYKCNDFMEEHFDWVIDSLQREDIDNYEKFICGEEAADVCSEEELSMPMMTLPEAPEDEKIAETPKPEVDLNNLSPETMKWVQDTINADKNNPDQPVNEDDDDHPGEEDPTYSLEEKEAMRQEALRKEKEEEEDEESDEGKEWIPYEGDEEEHVKDEL